MTMAQSKTLNSLHKSETRAISIAEFRASSTMNPDGHVIIEICGSIWIIYPDGHSRAA